jgi:hypothetical protein
MIRIARNTGIPASSPRSNGTSTIKPLTILLTVVGDSGLSSFHLFDLPFALIVPPQSNPKAVLCAALKELNDIIDGDRYFISQRIRTLKEIPSKIRPEPAREPPPPPMMLSNSLSKVRATSARGGWLRAPSDPNPLEVRGRGNGRHVSLRGFPRRATATALGREVELVALPDLPQAVRSMTRPGRRPSR